MFDMGFETSKPISNNWKWHTSNKITSPILVIYWKSAIPWSLNIKIFKALPDILFKLSHGPQYPVYDRLFRKGHQRIQTPPVQDRAESCWVNKHLISFHGLGVFISQVNAFSKCLWIFLGWNIYTFCLSLFCFIIKKNIYLLIQLWWHNGNWKVVRHFFLWSLL